MGPPQAGPGYPLAHPDASLTKSLECGYRFSPPMFLWLCECSEDAGDQVLVCRCGALSVSVICEDRKRVMCLTPGTDEGSPHPLGELGDLLIILEFLWRLFCRETVWDGDVRSDLGAH